MKIFTGLITHNKSKYRETRGYMDLAEALSELDGSGAVTIFDTDSYSERDIPRRQLFARIFLVALWDYRVKRFRRNSFARSLYAFLREARNEARRGLGEKARNWLARNRNITAAHVDLWSQALESGADWALIVEDDVVINHLTFKDKVQALVKFGERQETSSIAFFLTGSFTLEEHMAENLTSILVELGECQFRISKDRGWTDTVAATIYSRAFLDELTNFFSREPSTRKAVLPIDQLIDVFLIRSAKTSARIVTAHTLPPISQQQSLSLLDGPGFI